MCGQIVADNDAPVIPGPPSFYHLENSWFPLNNITVFDVDATDRLLPEETVLFFLQFSFLNHKNNISHGDNRNYCDYPVRESQG
jgi:hypothetical protein